MCTPQDHDYPIRVLDWGVARLGPIGRLTMDGLTPGTPIYMSPEQATGRDIAAPCDIYSLGIIAYEALTGRPPFDGRTLAEVVCMHLMRAPAPLRARCNAPVELCGLVNRMLHKDPKARPTAIEVRQTARAIARGLSDAAYEELEVSGLSAAPLSGRSATPAYMVPDDLGVGADELEFGSTEMLPVVRQPRWTPEIAGIATVLAEQHRAPIHPRSARDQVAGEIISTHKPR